MSNNTQDSEELKAKYAEIAALKRAIEEKKQEKNSRIHGYSENLNYQSRFHPYAARGSHYGYKPRPKHMAHFKNAGNGIHRNISMEFKKVKGSPEGDENKSVPEVQYISTISKGALRMVNSTVYESERQNSLQKIQQAKELREKVNKMKKEQALKQHVLKNITTTSNKDRIVIDNVRYAVTNGGLELVPLDDFTDQRDKYEWNETIYHRDMRGNLKASDVRRGREKMLDQCRYFAKHGSGLCQKGSRCKYDHDKDLISLCRLYMANNCTNQNCLLSHAPNQFNSPLCRYFLEGNCVNSKCAYQHVKPEKYGDPKYDIRICRPFAIGGSCVRGNKCPLVHLFKCPDFEESGTCPRGKVCTLAHPVTRETQERLESELAEFEDCADVVLVDSPQDKIVISSYTVDPKKLFTRGIEGKYDIYVDNGDDSKGITSIHGSKESLEFMIHLDSSESGSEGSYLDDSNSDSEEKISSISMSSNHQP